VRSTDDHLVVTLGLDKMIVVHTPDVTLVAAKEDEEAVRQVVKELERRGWTDVL
jgi:mannose-1-phosphate guanylyltransferase